MSPSPSPMVEAFMRGIIDEYPWAISTMGSSSIMYRPIRYFPHQPFVVFGYLTKVYMVAYNCAHKTI